MGFVHCGGTFETPTHYGTMYNSVVEMLIYCIFALRPHLHAIFPIVHEHNKWYYICKL